MNMAKCSIKKYMCVYTCRVLCLTCSWFALCCQSEDDLEFRFFSSSIHPKWTFLSLTGLLALRLYEKIAVAIQIMKALGYSFASFSWMWHMWTFLTTSVNRNVCSTATINRLKLHSKLNHSFILYLSAQWKQQCFSVQCVQVTFSSHPSLVHSLTSTVRLNLFVQRQTEALSWSCLGLVFYWRWEPVFFFSLFYQRKSYLHKWQETNECFEINYLLVIT